ncbi:hypothetical protein PENSPDRAFT_570434 [Peniophora sp. CONT]|nr:hypothetical protein PENSPDRAFT_570434 [Peniophora sp. CONT]
MTDNIEPKPVYKTKKVEGYYRYTDIWWKWPESLPEEERWQPIKCFFAHDALVHIDHPFHPGKEGVDLFVGVLKNGESRLLFSSKQVEYARYWIYAMGLTKEPLPLPCSDVLILPNELKHVGSMYYKTGSDLRGALKHLEKINKKVGKGGMDSSLANRRMIFENVRTLWAEKQGVWCAIDVESYEYEHTTLTELGYSIQRWENEEPVHENGHLCVKEAWRLRNGKYVPDAREKYDYGASEILPRTDFREKIRALIESLKQYGAVFLIFHDAASDIQYLLDDKYKINASLPNLSYLLPDKCKDGLYCVDTCDLWGALEGIPQDKRKLEHICRELGLKPQNMHNAGNDAYFTLGALRAMAEGAPLDQQRQARYPANRIEGLAVKEKDEDEDELDEELDLPNMKRVVAAPAGESANGAAA